LQNYTPLTLTGTATKTLKAHEKPASCLGVHIRKQIVATGGDDAVFKIYNMANHEELASGVGHSVINILFIYRNI
jgi:WD40 repeat protein